MHPVTGTLGRFTVLPLRAPRFGPKIRSAAAMSARRIGKLGMSLESAILANWHTPGNMIMF